MNCADQLRDGLLNLAIDVCFANPGTSEIHFVAALDRKPPMCSTAETVLEAVIRITSLGVETMLP